MKELQYLNKYFIKYKYRFLLGLFITIIAQIFSLFTPELIGNSIKVIEDYVKSSTKDVDLLKVSLLKNIFYILITTIIAGFFTFLMRQTLILMSGYGKFDFKK